MGKAYLEWGRVDWSLREALHLSVVWSGLGWLFGFEVFQAMIILSKENSSTHKGLQFTASLS